MDSKNYFNNQDLDQFNKVNFDYNNRKIFVIGMNKTATYSIYRFFEDNNISSIHWDWGKLAVFAEESFKKGEKSINTEYDKYTVFTDMEDMHEKRQIYLCRNKILKY